MCSLPSPPLCLPQGSFLNPAPLTLTSTEEIRPKGLQAFPGGRTHPELCLKQKSPVAWGPTAPTLASPLSPDAQPGH